MNNLQRLYLACDNDPSLSYETRSIRVMKNSTICFLNSRECARDGLHVGAFRWMRLGLIYLEANE